MIKAVFTFRVWCPEKDCYLYKDVLNYPGRRIEQCTGAKDRKKKYIYHRDIVRCFESKFSSVENSRLCEVRREGTALVVDVYRGHYDFLEVTQAIRVHGMTFEVIGNTNENNIEDFQL